MKDYAKDRKIFNNKPKKKRGWLILCLILVVIIIGIGLTLKTHHAPKVITPAPQATTPASATTEKITMQLPKDQTSTSKAANPKATTNNPSQSGDQSASHLDFYQTLPKMKVPSNNQ